MNLKKSKYSKSKFKKENRIVEIPSETPLPQACTKQATLKRNNIKKAEMQSVGLQRLRSRI